MLFRICVVEGIKIQKKKKFGLEMILHKPEDIGYVFVACLREVDSLRWDG